MAEVMAGLMKKYPQLLKSLPLFASMVLILQYREFPSPLISCSGCIAQATDLTLTTKCPNSSCVSDQSRVEKERERDSTEKERARDCTRSRAPLTVTPPKDVKNRDPA